MIDLIKENAKRLATDLTWLLIPGIILTAVLGALAPKVLAGCLGIALFVYFWKHQDKFIMFLLIYIPFEELILKLLPDSMYAPVRYIWELMAMAMMGLLIFEKLFLNRKWKSSPIDFLAIFFLAIWLISTVVNSKPLFFSLSHIKNFVRYIPLFYIVYNLKPDPRLLSKVLKILLLLAAIQSILVLLQATGNGTLTNIFRPKEVVIGDQIIRGEDIQTGTYYTKFTGTFDRTIHLGNYLTFALCFAAGLYFVSNRKKSLLLLMGLFVTALFISSSRISWISAFLAIGVILFRIRHRFRIAYFVVPVLALAFLVAGAAAYDDESLAGDFKILDRFIYIFTPDYLEVAGDTGRLYAILYAAPAVFTSNPLLGMGPGTFMQISEQMESEDIFGGAGASKLESAALRYVPDVGYVALFVQVGLLGLLTVIMVFIRLFRLALRRAGNTTDLKVRAFYVGIVGFIVSLAVQNWASFNLMYRNQSIIIWVMLGFAVLFDRENRIEQIVGSKPDKIDIESGI